MFQKHTLVVLTAMVMLFACSAVLATDNSMGIAEKRTITFTAPTLVGGTLLPAGNYNVNHQMSGQTHVMVFTQIGGKAEAKANCTLLSLKTKAPRTQQRYITNAKNERVLEEMTFQGDKASHILVQ